MKAYIDFNTDIDFNLDKRQESTNESDKNLFKLMNNAVCGSLCSQGFIKYRSRPTCIN